MLWTYFTIRYARRMAFKNPKDYLPMREVFEIEEKNDKHLTLLLAKQIKTNDRPNKRSTHMKSKNMSAFESFSVNRAGIYVSTIIALLILHHKYVYLLFV